MNKISFFLTAVFLTVGMLHAPQLYSQAQEPKVAFEYESRGRRDPFVPLIGQEKAKKISSLVDITSIEDIKLEGIAIDSSGKNMAILNGQMVKDNDKFGALIIKKISQRNVQLSMEGKDYTLNLTKPEEETTVGQQ